MNYSTSNMKSAVAIEASRQKEDDEDRKLEENGEVGDFQLRVKPANEEGALVT